MYEVIKFNAYHEEQLLMSSSDKNAAILRCSKEKDCSVYDNINDCCIYATSLNNSEPINILAPAIGRLPQIELQLIYKRGEFIFDITSNGKIVGKIGEKSTLDNINNGLYIITN